VKRIYLLSIVFIVLLTASACLAGDPDLVGKWQGPMTMHSLERGFVSSDGSVAMLVIEEQRDGAFCGEQVLTLNGKTRKEKFSGVLSPDGKKVYFTGHDDGYYIGEISGPDEMVVYYLEEGPKAKAMRHTLKRIK